MTETERNRVFKARVLRGGAILLPGVANPLTALIAADLGYEALYLTGAGVSNMSHGLPDLGLTNLSDVAQALRAIRAVVELPLVADADTGFGNAVNVYHTVRTLEAAGANAIQLEDQVFPKKCGHFDGKGVIPTAEMAAKIRAATDARRDANLQIIARTDARAIDGFDAAVERAQVYVDAGADILFVEALIDEAEIRALPKKLARPQLINIVHGGKTPALPFEELDRLGYGLVLYANAALQAAVTATQRVLSELRRVGSLATVAQELTSFAERQRIVRKDQFDALEHRYSNMSKAE
jgi:2-methylisocitrate lyase-like PEP mutase family enzyme